MGGHRGYDVITLILPLLASCSSSPAGGSRTKGLMTIPASSLTPPRPEALAGIMHCSSFPPTSQLDLNKLASVQEAATVCQHPSSLPHPEALATITHSCSFVQSQPAALPSRTLKPQLGSFWTAASHHWSAGSVIPAQQEVAEEPFLAALSAAGDQRGGMWCSWRGTAPLHHHGYRPDG